MKEALHAYRDKRHDDAMTAFDVIVKLHSYQDAAKGAGAVMEEADKVYKEGIDKDGQGQWADAEALFKNSSIQYGLVASLFPIGDPGARSSVREHLARARQAVEDASMAKSDAERQPFWTIASAEDDDPKSPSSAKTALEEAQCRQKCGPWVSEIEKEISDFTDSRLSCRAFWSAIDETTDLVRRGKFEEARTALNNKISSNPWARITKPQEDVLSDLRRRIDVGDFEVKFKALMDSAQEAAKQGNFAPAKEYLDKASALLNDPLAQNITPNVRARHEKEIGDLREKTRVGGDFDKEMKLADQAKENDDKPGELEHLQNAIKNCPPKELKGLDDRIKSLQSRTALDEGKALAKEGHFAEARTKLEESLRFKDNPEAKALLDKITLSEKYQALLTAAKAAMNRGDFEKAADLFQKAQEIDPTDEDVKASLNNCLYQVTFAKAKALIQAKKYDEGVKLLEECRKLNPEKGLEIDPLEEEIKTTRGYDKAIDAGKLCLQAGQWHKARDRFEEARKIKDSPEAKDLINKAHYGENKERGQSEFDQGHWESALGYFKIAQGKYDCEEIQKLIAATQGKITVNK